MASLCARLILCVQEVVTPFYIVTYYIKWVTTSWTHSLSVSSDGQKTLEGISLPVSLHVQYYSIVKLSNEETMTAFVMKIWMEKVHRENYN